MEDRTELSEASSGPSLCPWRPGDPPAHSWGANLFSAPLPGLRRAILSRISMGGTQTSTVLCRYFLHGSCLRGQECPFSHSLQDAESQVLSVLACLIGAWACHSAPPLPLRPPPVVGASPLTHWVSPVVVPSLAQVCRFYQRGACVYGERCRYLHVKPDWGPRQAGQSGGTRSGGSGTRAYAPPAAPRPATDDLTEQLPVSQLRLGGQAAEAASALAAPAQLPWPIHLQQEQQQLPADPFGSGAAEEEEGYGDWPSELEPEQWEYGAHAEQQWGGEGEEEWYEGGGAEYWEQQQQQGQQQELQPPGERGAPAWSLPAGGMAHPGLGAASMQHPSLRSLCMQWFTSGTCSKGDRCTLVHGDLCQVGGWLHMGVGGCTWGDRYTLVHGGLCRVGGCTWRCASQGGRVPRGGQPLLPAPGPRNSGRENRSTLVGHHLPPS